MKKALFGILILSLTLFSGCSEPPEDMSTIRPNLILEIFKLIKQERHEEAYIKIKKLRELDPTNTYLPILEDAEKNNSELQRVNKLLADKTKQNQATEILKELMEKQNNGMKDSEAFVAAEKLKDVLRLDQLTDIIIAPKPVFEKNHKFHPASKVLRDAIEEFVRISQKWNISPKLRNKVIRRMENVAKLRKEETRRAAQSLELLAYGLKENSFQTMMALSDQVEDGTK